MHWIMLLSVFKVRSFMVKREEGGREGGEWSVAKGGGREKRIN